MVLLAEIESAIAGVARSRGPAVVGIERRSGRGTGFVLARDQVLTLASNLRDPTGDVGVAFGGGRPDATGSVAGIDGGLDLALIRVPTDEIEPLAFAPAPGAGLGAAVIALANPGGQGLRATLGFVAATDRRHRGPRGRVVGTALEHTAAMVRGSGGGPLLDLDGRVVGVNAVRVAGGLILALPASEVAARAAALGRDGGDATPALGVALVSPAVAGRLRRAVGLPDRDGLLVHEVAAGSPAERADVRPGDLIVAAAQKPIDGVDALYAALDLADGTIDLQIVRGVDEHTIQVSLT